MFDDLKELSGKALAREAERELYGADVDGPPAKSFDTGMEFDLAWATGIGNSMIRVYNNRAAGLGLPRLLADDTGRMKKGGRSCELQLEFLGGFEVRYVIADPRESGLHVGLILHRLIRRACRDRGRKHQFKMVNQRD